MMDDGLHRVNPASGLPMVGMGTGVDVDGNPFGSSGIHFFSETSLAEFKTFDGADSRFLKAAKWLVLIGGGSAFVVAWLILIISAVERLT
jgi:hypothetical protein